MKALVDCGAEVIAVSRTETDLISLKQEVSNSGTVFRPVTVSMPTTSITLSLSLALLCCTYAHMRAIFLCACQIMLTLS